MNRYEVTMNDDGNVTFEASYVEMASIPGWILFFLKDDDSYEIKAGFQASEVKIFKMSESVKDNKNG